MKSLVVLIAVILCLTSSAGAEWHLQAVDAEGFNGICPAISLDSSDHPRIVYDRESFGVKYAEFDGSSWNIEYIYQPSGNCGWFDMVTDDQDLSHVSFSHGGLMYACQDSTSGSWTVESLPAAGGGRCTSIDLDSQDDPWIAYFNDDTGYWFYYKDVSGWVEEFIDAATLWDGWNSLAIDDGDVAHLAFTTDAPSAGVRYAVRTDPDQWETCYVDSAMTEAPLDVFIALRSDGLPGISYNVNGEVRYASYDGFEWTIDIVDAVDTGPWEYGTSLAYDCYDHPHLAYCDLSADSLVYAVDHGSGWQRSCLCDIPGGGGDPDLVLDSQGRPHIAFCRTGELWYAYDDEPLSIEVTESEPIVLDVTAAPNPFSGFISISFSSREPIDLSIAVYDISGRRISTPFSGSCSEGSHTVCWTPEKSLPSGEYILVLENGERKAAERLVYLR